MKLWILAVKLSAASDDEDVNELPEQTDVENTTMMIVWSELWPPLEAVVTSLEQHGSSSNLLVRT